MSDHLQRLINFIYSQFKTSGKWPTTRVVDREFAAEFELEEFVRDWRDYIVCGEMWHPESKCVLTLLGTSFVPDARIDLERLVQLLPVLLEKYYNGEQLTRIDAAARLVIEDVDAVRLFELLDASNLTSGGSSDSSGWREFGVSPVIRKFRSVRTVEEFIARFQSLMRAAQEAQSAAFPQVERETVVSTVVVPAVHVPSDLLLDTSLQQTLEADLAELRVCLENEAWKAVGLLAGSCCEAILIDLLQRDPSVIPVKRQDQWQTRLGLQHLAEIAKAANLISPESHLLVSALKRWRDLVHPWRAATHKLPSATSAKAMLMFLELLAADLRASVVQVNAEEASQAL